MRVAKICVKEVTGGLLVSNLYCRQCTGGSGTKSTYYGKDMDTLTSGWTAMPSHSVGKVTLAPVAGDDSGARAVTFKGAFASGGQLNISGRVNFRGTSAALGTKDAANYTQAVDFNGGAFTFLDAGAFTNAMTVTGNDGLVDYVYTEGVTTSTVSSILLKTAALPKSAATAVKVLENVNVGSIVKATCSVHFLAYNSSNKVTPDSAYKNPLKAARYNYVGDETVAKFQIKGSGLYYGATVVFKQVGKDVYAYIAGGCDAWPSMDPTATSAWTWDHANEYSTDGNYRALDIGKITVSNLVFDVRGETDLYNSTTTVKMNGTDTSQRVTYRARTTRGRPVQLATVGMTARPHEAGLIEAKGEGSYYSLAVSGSTGGNQGLWSGLSQPPKIYIHDGGRGITEYANQLNASQTLTVDNARFFVWEKTKDTARIMGCKAGNDSNRCQNWLEELVLRNGAYITGYRLHFARGNLGEKVTIVVDGTGKVPFKNGLYLGGSNTASWDAAATNYTSTLTMTVADTTGDDGVDAEIGVYGKNSFFGNYGTTGWNFTQFIKDGPGTLEIQGPNEMNALPIVLRKGLLKINCPSAYNKPSTAMKLDFQGGSFLRSGNASTNSVSTLTVRRSGDLRITGKNAELHFANSSALASDWAVGQILNITVEDASSGIFFGSDASGLTPAQLHCLRLNGGRCTLSANGKLVPRPVNGMAVILR